MRPVGVLECEPMAVGLESALQHPLGFALLLGNQANDILIETTTNGLGLDVTNETILIIAGLEFLKYILCILFHHILFNSQI